MKGYYVGYVSGERAIYRLGKRTGTMSLNGSDGEGDGILSDRFNTKEEAEYWCKKKIEEIYDILLQNQEELEDIDYSRYDIDIMPCWKSQYHPIEITRGGGIRGVLLYKHCILVYAFYDYRIHYITEYDNIRTEFKSINITTLTNRIPCYQ